jgi:protein PhnA
VEATNPPCPKCQYEYTYQDQALWICPECNHEWDENQVASNTESPVGAKFLDANGVELKDGDSVTVIKNLKISGTQTLKAGTKVKSIRLLEEPVNGHDISCKIDGFGAMYLKCEIVKKA